MDGELRPELKELNRRLAKTLDHDRYEALAKRHGKGFRSARENLQDLVDPDSFVEYGQLAVAAQRSRRDYEDLQSRTAADGIVTGLATINADKVGSSAAQAVVVVNDYSVLAGTQGFFHHKKLDRACELAAQYSLPVVMYTEGGGGRPGDTDVTTQIAGLNVPSFSSWARLSGKVPRIAVNNGYCFAGNAALFGCADFGIATRQSWIGMAGPAMIEGGGLGSYEATEIGPIKTQERNGVVDIVAEDEADATRLAKQLLSYFQGPITQWQCADQEPLRDIVPEDRRWAYPVRTIISTVADQGSFLELRRVYGRSVITGFIRLEGRAVGLIANDCQQLGGALDSESSEKAAEFLRICNEFGLPVLSLTDTPGFMVGPASEEAGAVRRMSTLFRAGASISVPVVAIFLRKGYGLGAMAMVGGSFLDPVYAAAWPSGEFGGMGLEGAVRLGFKKELEAETDATKRTALFDELVARLYEIGKATEAAAHLEIDAVIDPVDTRAHVIRALAAAGYGA
jgi:acetyl-CoA carboxylase carboxyltransferase component